MIEIKNKFLLAGDKFIAEIYLRQLHLTTVVGDHLVKTKN